MAAKTLKPCYCSKFEFGTTTDTESGPDFVGHDTGCGQTTARTFAMGHDAKLAGFLVRAELDDLEIVLTDGGVAHSFGSAVAAARTVSDAFAAKVARGMEVAIAKASRKTRKTAKSADPAPAVEIAAPAVEVPTTREARIKVGRWTYNAVIDLATNNATYTSKLGVKTTVIPSKWSEAA